MKKMRRLLNNRKQSMFVDTDTYTCIEHPQENCVLLSGGIHL